MTEGFLEKKTLSAADYVVFALSLLIALGIGIWGAVTGRRYNAEESLAKAKGVSLIPITMSLLATYLSAVTLVGVPAEVYANGSQWMVHPIGCAVGILISAYLIVPLMYNLRMSSLFEYLERRYRSKAVRFIGVILFVVLNSLYMGVALYAPVLAISKAADFPQWIGIISAGGICTIYTVIGGLRAVIWTDVFQMVVMIVGMLAIIIAGCMQVGGIGNVFQISHEFGRTSWFDFSLDPYKRHTTWLLLGNACVLWIGVHGTNQASFQRYNSLPDLRLGMRSINLNAPAVILVVWMSGLTGLCLFANYAHCDPLKAGVIKKPDEIVPYFVLERLSGIYGLPGLFLSCLFSGALSTMSSGMNALASVIWSDVVQLTSTGRNLTEFHSQVFTKLTSLGFGVLAIGIAFLASSVDGVLQFCVTVTSTFSAPTLSLFLTSVLLPFVNKKGVLVGTIASFVVACWIGFTSYALKIPGPKPLPSSLDQCPPNSTVAFFLEAARSATDDYSETTPKFQSYNLTGEFPPATWTEGRVEADSEDALPYAKIYYISYLMYLQMGFGTGVVVTVLVSLATGGQNLDELEPGVVHPLGFRIFFRKRRDLIEAAEASLRSRAAAADGGGGGDGKGGDGPPPPPPPRRDGAKRHESEMTIVYRAEPTPGRDGGSSSAVSFGRMSGNENLGYAGAAGVADVGGGGDADEDGLRMKR